MVLAAGLSGLAQAVYLAGGITHPTTTAAPVGLRFGVGAWPAIAAALTAHLLHLIGTGAAREDGAALTTTGQLAPGAAVLSSADVHPYNAAGAAVLSSADVHPYNEPGVQLAACSRPHGPAAITAAYG